MVVASYGVGIVGIGLGLIFLWRFNVWCSRCIKANPKEKSAADAKKGPPGDDPQPSGAGGMPDLLGAIQHFGNFAIVILVFLMGALLTMYIALSGKVVDVSLAISGFSGKFDQTIQLLKDIKILLMK